MSNPYQPPSDPPQGGQQYPQQGYPQAPYQGQGDDTGRQYPGYQQPGQQHPGYQQPGQPYPGEPYQGYQQYPGGQQYPGQQYPGQQGYPQPYPGPSQPPGRTVAPAPVTAAFGVYLLAAAIALVGMVLALNSDIWAQAVRESGVDRQDLGGMSVDSVITIAKGLVIAVGVVFVALYLLFAFKMRAGRNWARITLTVLSALSLLSTVNATGSLTINDRTYSSATSATTGWIGAVLAVVAIVLMYLPSANEYFRTVKAQRLRQKLQQYQG